MEFNSSTHPSVPVLSPCATRWACMP